MSAPKAFWAHTYVHNWSSIDTKVIHLANNLILLWPKVVYMLSEFSFGLQKFSKKIFPALFFLQHITFNKNIFTIQFLISQFNFLIHSFHFLIHSFQFSISLKLGEFFSRCIRQLRTIWLQIRNLRIKIYLVACFDFELRAYTRTFVSKFLRGGPRGIKKMTLWIKKF